MKEYQFTSRRFQFIIDAFNCNTELLANRQFIDRLIKQIAKLLDMKIIKGPEIVEGAFKNPGLTAFAIIDFSHISIHTFTNTKEFCLDVFSCKPFDYKKLEHAIKIKFNLNKKQIFKSIVRYDQLDIEQDKKGFSPKQYLDEYYQKLYRENVKLLDWYDDVYSTINKKDFLLEIGGGPTIYQLISAATKVRSITFTDYYRKNVNSVKKWVENKNSFWDKFIEYSLKIEQKEKPTKRAINQRKEILANKIKNFLLLDAGKIDEDLISKFDIVQSNFCLESSTDDISEYKRMLNNLFSYLKPDGIFLMVALEGAMAYRVGNKYFPSIYLDQELVGEYLEEAGFKIEKMEKVNSENPDYSKYHGFLFVKAVKT